MPSAVVIVPRKYRGRKPDYAYPVFMTALREPDDMAEHRDPAESTDRSDPTDPIEKAERNDPTDPIERAEPIEPIDMKDPRLPIDRTEFSDHSDHRERAGFEAMPHSCRWIEAALRPSFTCRLLRVTAPAPGGSVGSRHPISTRGPGRQLGLRDPAR